MDKDSYEYLLSINRAPTLKDIILSQTYMYENLLENPDGIRKFVKDHIHSSMPTALQKHFYDEYDCQTHGGKSLYIYNTLTTNNLVEMRLYDSRRDARGSHLCCHTTYEVYIGLQLNEDNTQLSIRQMIVTSTGCDEGDTTLFYKSAEPCDIDSFKDISIKKFLTRYPEFINTIDLYDHTELLIKTLEQ